MTVDYRLLAPMLTLTGLAVVVLALDLIFLRARKEWLGWFTAAGAAAAIAVLAATWRHVSATPGPHSLWNGILLVDGLALFFQLMFLSALLLVSLASVHYAARSFRHPGEYYLLLVFCTLGLSLMVSAGELITLYLGLEMSTITLYALAGFLKRNPRSGEAGLKYFLLGATASAVFLYGASLLYGALGTTVLADMTSRLPSGLRPSPVVLFGAVFVLAGFGFKITAAPFHMWAPDVYQGAPTPVTGFLSVASKAAGFAVLLRVFFGPLAAASPQWAVIVSALALMSMIVGNLLALPQTNIKRMMAYSGIAQAGYVLVAVAAVSSEAVAATSFFLFQYIFANLGAFIAITLVGSAVGNDEIRSYAGLSRRNPLLAFCLLIVLLSLGGIPPLSGFWGKLYLFWAAAQQQLYGLVLVGVLATVVSLYYYLMVARQMYIEDPREEAAVPVPRSAAIALVIITVAVIALGYPKPWLALGHAAARALF